ncbi:SMP-30/gluconolactonase/LRE family protein [Nocardiopsis halotolerans]|uniref:SMP-30/gluconolactonase/LRE family protein n=1 Tax=Nocardiopsis halotolerans TaxID=124252 RepID=UPI00034BBA51|nr:SMP-30/gluconolactonase/LRE family protein [Nocardiopsis halotolerans]
MPSPTPKNRGRARTTAATLVAGTVFTACLIPASPASASAETDHRPPGPPFRQITGSFPELYPEGIAWDPTRNGFIVGSALHGNLALIEPGGETEELVPSIGPVSTLGVRVDTERDRVLVAYSDFWTRQEMDTGMPPTSGVAAFDLHTLELVFDTEISGNLDRTFGNDLTYDADGTVYVTDSVSQTLYGISTEGEPEVVADDPRFAADMVGLNGIVWHEDGYLLAVRYDNGELFRIDLDEPLGSRVTEVELPEPMLGTDGIRLRPDGSLYVVTNSIGENAGIPSGTDGVTVLRSDDGWDSARIERSHEPWPVEGPTNIAITPFGDYVLSGNVGVLMGGGTSDTFVLRRL